MAKRLIEKNTKKSDDLKKMLPFSKNKIETMRINVMIIYFNGISSNDIPKILGTTKQFVLDVIHSYINNGDNFYKTKYKGKKEIYGKDYSETIQKEIEKAKTENRGVSIIGIVKLLGLENNSKNYNTVWYLTRRKMKLNYQKPYVEDKKSPKNAKEILKKKYKGKFKLR